MYYSYPFLYQNLWPVDSAARQEARSARSEVDELREQVDRMALFNMAVWSLAAEKLGIIEDDLKKRVQEIDLSDGKLDDKISQNVGECPKCKKRLSRRNRSCIYCGYKMPVTFPG